MTMLPGGPLEDEQAHAALIKKQVEPIAAGDQVKPAQRQGMFRGIAALWHWLCGHTEADIKRLKEAGFRKLETENELREADVLLKKAQAVETMSRAAGQFSEEELTRASEATQALLQETVPDAVPSADQARINAALERLEAARQVIRMKGGDVCFDEAQLRRQVIQADREYPGDPAIRPHAKEAESLPEDDQAGTDVKQD
jgi:hypothetical protein